MRGAFLGCGLLLAASVASAQSVRLEVAPGPHYTDDAVQLNVVAEGFEEEPVPVVQSSPPQRGILISTGVQPSVSTSLVISNGQVRRRKEVSFSFGYQLSAAEPGPITLGPFTVVQGGTTARSGKVRLDLQPVPANDQLSVELELPEAPVFVGERVPVTLRFQVGDRLRANLHQYTLRVPFFDRSDAFQFLEPTDNPGSTKIEVQTPNGVVAMMGHARETQRGGGRELLVELRRIAVPLKDGALEIPASSLDLEEGVRYRRDLFGGRRPTQVRRWRSVDKLRRLVVKRIPTEGAPGSFAGAVGSGFSLAVSADRTVVQVGEPITLEFELRGDGNLETAALPRLDASGMLPSAQFRVPEADITGRLEAGTKHFTATVRVLDSQLREVPALEYSWFDPTSEQFRTTRSRPIALSVRDAEVIGAAQVQSGEPAPAGAAVVGERSRGSASPRSAPLRLTGADLAIERNPSLLLRAPAGRARNAGTIVALYAGSLLLVGLARFDRRRRNLDPAIAARRRRVEAELQRIRQAASLPADDAVAELARGLRALLSEVPDGGPRAEIDAFVGQCDARSYAPDRGHDASPLDPATASRALELAQSLAESAP